MGRAVGGAGRDGAREHACHGPYIAPHTPPGETARARCSRTPPRAAQRAHISARFFRAVPSRAALRCCARGGWCAPVLEPGGRAWPPRCLMSRVRRSTLATCHTVLRKSQRLALRRGTKVYESRKLDVHVRCCCCFNGLRMKFQASFLCRPKPYTSTQCNSINDNHG